MAGSPDVLTGTFAGRYTIERELGSGATATVYLARDTQRGISDAVKLLRPELAQSVGADRFLREIRLNEKLHHPHIVQVLDSGEQDGRLYFVLPHMEDGSLRQLLQREKQLPIETAIAIARTIAQALDYAHQQNLIHRDVKPENILFTSGQACLADFGIARAVERALDESTTDTGMVRGTPAYMSPEQASGSRQYDGRSDQYSLACVLYEMLAGVPAFIGPTPEAVIAQRFQHQPRELRVYRPTVPASVESVIQKALTIAPADRFATTAEFAKALDSAQRTPTIERRASGPSIGISGRRVAAAGGATLFLVAAIFLVLINSKKIFGRGGAVADTTRYVALPVEADTGVPSQRITNHLSAALNRWRGMSVASDFELQQALGGQNGKARGQSAVQIARRLNAGRVVRARVARDADALRVHGALFDVAADSQVYQASVGLRLDFADADVVIERLVAMLLLRGDTVSGSRSLPALQLYASGQNAFLQFDLTRADSLFQAAVHLDRDFNQAALWLAQLRAWRGDATTAWLAFADRARNGGRLSSRERTLADALVALAGRDFATACSGYNALRRENPNDYVAWYGIGECHRLDTRVVRDRRSPSGWRFMSSQHRAAAAYAKAFETAATTHNGFAPGAYAQLVKLLFADRARVRPGTAVPPDRQDFLAYQVWDGDSLAFVPYPSTLILSGAHAPEPGLRMRALERQRAEYERIAKVWAATQPTSPGAKEALAIALEMKGEPSAADTLRLARDLTSVPRMRLRLAAEEFFVRVASGRNDVTRLRAAVGLADSLLSSRGVSPEQAAVLAPVAAMLGRCRLSASLAARATTLQLAEKTPYQHFVLAAAESVTVAAALGCARPEAIRTVVDAGMANRADTGRVRDRMEYALFSQAVSLLSPPDSERIARMAATGDYLHRVQRAALHGQVDTVRVLLGRRQVSRGKLGAAEMSLDAALAEARAWLAIGDSASARSWLDPVIDRRGWLEKLWEGEVQAASLVLGIALRADLAAAHGDSIRTRRLADMVAILWKDSDSELQPVVRRMERLARR